MWLNAAHQGPLPRRAAVAAQEALAEKVSPWKLEDSEFWELPIAVKRSIARIIGAPEEEIILGNSTSYGLNLLAHGLPLREGDEVLLVDGDFPATVVTWMPLRERGITVRLLKPSGPVVTAADVAREIGPATRVFASSWVFSFTGFAADIGAIGRVCKERDVLFVVNASQAVGARPIDVRETPVDALVGCGFKWLCGPYATGYAWMRPSVVASLGNRPAYWLSQIGAGELGTGDGYRVREDLGAAAFDVFCTANFLNFAAWNESLSLIGDIGVESIGRHDSELIDRLVEGIDDAGFDLSSPRDGTQRSTLVFFSHADPNANDTVHRHLIDRQIHVARRAGALRVSPHLYNTGDDVERLVDALRSAR